MVKHVVMWRLREFGAEGEREEACRFIKASLEGLVGVVDGLLKAEVGSNFNPNGFDLCLYTELSGRAELESYQSHPEHLKIREFIHTVITERVVCDWDC